MATIGGSGGGEDPGGDKRGSVGRQMVPGKGQGQRHVDVSGDLEDSSSFQHSGPKRAAEERRRAVRIKTRKSSNRKHGINFIICTLPKKQKRKKKKE